MLGLWFFVVLILLIFHWGMVIPKSFNSDNGDWVAALMLFGTACCLVPPVYLFIGLLYLVFKRGVKKYVKKDS